MPNAAMRLCIIAGCGLLNGLGRKTHREGLNRGLRLHMQETVGNVTKTFDMGAEILGVAFNEAGDFDRYRIAGVGVVGAAMTSASVRPVN